ncbi:MAG: low molecular weight phosphotyrosine protein phosphatase [Chlorobi bacterium]|nr:low molecular weight phosphotyrosine protein phosphatase [Chlorobiota bacterium]
MTSIKRNIIGTPANSHNYNSHSRLRILFVCLGNICRSPTAEALFNYLHKSGKAIAFSRGTDYWHYGEPVCSLMRRVLEEEGVPAPERGAKIMEPSQISQFSLVIPVDKKVESYLKEVLSKKHHRKILPYMELTGGKEVPDPYKKDLNAAREAYSIIKEGVENLIALLS